MSEPFSSLQSNDSRLRDAVEVYAYQRAARNAGGFDVARRAAVRLLSKTAHPDSGINDSVTRFTRNLAEQIDGNRNQTALEAAAGLVVDVMALQLLEGDRAESFGSGAHRRIAVQELTKEFSGNRGGLSAPEKVYKGYANRNGIDGAVVSEAIAGFKATIEQVLPSLSPGLGDQLGR